MSYKAKYCNGFYPAITQFGNSKVTVYKENDELSDYLCTFVLSILTLGCTFCFAMTVSLDPTRSALINLKVSHGYATDKK